MSTAVVMSPRASIDDVDLRRRISAGDVDAVTECYRLHAGLVRSYVARFVPHHEVDDVTQAVFFELWRTAHRYDADRSLRAWLFGIARKRALDQLRNSRAKGSLGIPLDIVGDVAGCDGRALADERASRAFILGALAQLPLPQAVVLQLAYFDGYTQVEIAALLHVPLGTVKTRSSRGLRTLAKVLVVAD